MGRPGARHRAVNLVQVSPAWSGFAAGLLRAHQRHTQTEPTPSRGSDAELAQVIRAVNETIAVLLDMPADAVAIGELVSQITACWLSYRACPDTDRTIAALLKAQRDYDIAVQQLPLLHRSLR
ncbi:hypothetical protein DFR70_11148 [Nocardia tenerifensis]|uniref:Uncharacterized protein n=1 Tax=Nocardia tenerifensis TaxID=228006 RepID=A0A318JT08_9NOCA|nr:hypothetical protein DFR70_11148 [Nocardia tenerifensis]